MDEAEEGPVPARHAEAAEEIRAHLCALRGAGLFLSPMDSWRLIQWLDRGVRVSDVLVALERAAEARRASRSRLPLTLGAASRHLGKASKGPATRLAAPGEPSLAPLVPPPPGEPELRAAVERLVSGLGSVRPGAEEEVRRAIGLIRTFLQEAWQALGEHGRDELRTAARQDLGDLLHLVDEATALDLVEETARDLLRQRWPALTAASVRHLLDAPVG